MGACLLIGIFELVKTNVDGSFLGSPSCTRLESPTNRVQLGNPRMGNEHGSWLPQEILRQGHAHHLRAVDTSIKGDVGRDKEGAGGDKIKNMLFI